ncbi:MAG: hypothetical protein CL452_01090 [Acidimicrobiaceae bacterium]|nr:hypothetical protein [Acidimicrobiaceae bacterium]
MENLDLFSTAELLNNVFKPKTPITTEQLEWQYHKNPAGSACIGYLLEANRQISNYALIPKIFKNHLGNEITLGVGVDLAVSPDSRGKGLFRKTIENSYKAGIKGNLDGILGVANSQSSPRMTEAMGWRKLPSLDFRLLKVSRSGAVLHTSQHKSDYKSCTVDGLRDLETFAPSSSFSPLWNAELLNWRLSRPGVDYYTHSHESAFLITTKISIRGIKIAVLLKAFPVDPNKTPLSITPFVSGVAKYHKTPFVVHWGKNPHFKINGLKIPRKFQPSPLDLVVHFFHEENNFELNEFELLDFDAF